MCPAAAFPAISSGAEVVSHEKGEDVDIGRARVETWLEDELKLLNGDAVLGSDSACSELEIRSLQPPQSERVLGSR